MSKAGFHMDNLNGKLKHGFTHGVLESRYIILKLSIMSNPFTSL